MRSLQLIFIGPGGYGLAAEGINRVLRNRVFLLFGAARKRDKPDKN